MVFCADSDTIPSPSYADTIPCPPPEDSTILPPPPVSWPEMFERFESDRVAALLGWVA